MKKSVKIPAFVFKPVFKEKTSKAVIQRQDDILEIEFPVFEADEILKITEQLSVKKRWAHDRPIDEVISVIDQVGALWSNPNYDLRKEAMEVIPMTTGQSKELCEMELYGALQLWNKQSAEAELLAELGGKQYLDDWVPKGTMKLHAQPRGLILHNIAGNAFNVGMLSLYFGLITKNVNLVKLPHEEPFFTVKIAESIADVDKKFAKEIAVLYWKGSQTSIFNKIFDSGHVNGVIAWGGLQSIEDIRRRAYHYGIKVIDHGPKMSFSIISDDVLKDVNSMKDLAQKIANDVAVWNQRACVSPRVIYIKEKPRKSAVFGKNHNSKYNFEEEEDDLDLFQRKVFETYNNGLKDEVKDNFDLTALMQRSAKLLRNEITDLSPLGFARFLADAMDRTDKILPRAHLSEADGMEMRSKREYFSMKYEVSQNGVLFTPVNEKLNWTVAYLRNPPIMKEIDMCMNRFVIVTRISNIKDLVHFAKSEELEHYLQTISIYGNEEFIEEVAEEFSLLGAARFPRIGEHNYVKIGSPWDGHYVINDIVRWVSIGFINVHGEEELKH